MKNKFAKSLSLATAFMMLLSACGSNPSADAGQAEPVDTKVVENEEVPAADGEETTGEPTVIRWGHNWIAEMDTSYVDPVTGESPLGLEEYNARVYAEQQVLEKLNAKIEFVQYPTDVTEDILQSVLAGDPIADIVRTYNNTQGKVLAQNVLQPLDDYTYLFEDEDDKWILWGETYGHHYFLNNVMRFGANELLSYNIGMLDKVDALKVDGKTKYPADYFVEGNWTWSVFEDYLQKVNDYFKQEWEGYYAYQTDYRAAALDAIYSNGGEVYGDSGFGADSPEAKEAIEFIDSLIQKGLMFSENQYSNTQEVQGLMDTWRFQWGHTAFVNLPQWLTGDMVSQFADRGDAMGVVPFPRPDDMAFDDQNYRQLNDATDCYAVPKGISPEKTELAVKVFKEYTQSYYKYLTGSDKAMDYMTTDAGIRNEAIRLHYDVTNEEYGENMLKGFQYLVTGDNAYVNDYSKNAGIYDFWCEEVLGKSLYGIGGAPKYSVQMDASKAQIMDVMNNYTAVLKSEDIKDNIAPKITQIEGTEFVFAAGTKAEDIQLADLVSINDNIDGALDISIASVDYSELDFDTPGKYDGGIKVAVKDASDNEATAKFSAIIYDAANTSAPNLVIRPAEEFRTIGYEEDAGNINWKDDFVSEAADANGLDLKDRVKADLSELDTTTPGEYSVVISVTDYAGNETSETITVTVSAQE
ncbi:MAG: hypothetical protein K6G30_13690 [Acetatifactor sp.]|nr:hypothetical protein [Acetatifactor sp.]